MASHIGRRLACGARDAFTLARLKALGVNPAADDPGAVSKNPIVVTIDGRVEIGHISVSGEASFHQWATGSSR
jgi:hypothetical protein